MISIPPSLDMRLLHLEKTTSTNSVAVDAAEAGESEGLVVLADLQSHGRGRQGRSWLAPPGTGLCFSLLRRPEVEPVLRPYWTVLAGVAVHAALQDEIAGLWLKWPNDLMVGVSKLGGVLCEVAESGAAGAPPAIVVGMGVNLRAPLEGWPDGLLARATSIAEEAPDASLPRGVLLVRILEAFVSRERQLMGHGPEALLAEFRSCMSPLVGRFVQVEKGSGLVRAEVLGVADSGALEVVDESGVVHRLLAGDVHLGAI